MIAGICAGLFALLLCVDMGIKQYVEDDFREREERDTLIPGMVMRKAYNKGFAFNILEDRPEIVKRTSVAGCVVILLYDIYLFFRKKKNFRKLGMAFVTAGALSNTYDRVIRGKVIDYIGYKGKRGKGFLGQVTWNLADLFLVAGAAMTGLSRSHGKRQKARAKAKKAAAKSKSTRHAATAARRACLSGSKPVNG